MFNGAISAMHFFQEREPDFLTLIDFIFSYISRGTGRMGICTGLICFA
jgi:hypothetical protein